MDRQPFAANTTEPIYRATVALFLGARGVDLDADPHAVSEFGKTAANLYRRHRGHAPGEVLQLVNGRYRPVYCYRREEIAILWAVWNRSPINLAAAFRELFASADLIEPGDAVAYHGSIEALWGEWLAVPCRCTRCGEGDEVGEADPRYALLDTERGEVAMLNVRRSSITRCTADA